MTLALIRVHWFGDCVRNKGSNGCIKGEVKSKYSAGVKK
jgi:hypothetical protein